MDGPDDILRAGNCGRPTLDERGGGRGGSGRRATGEGIGGSSCAAGTFGRACTRAIGA